MSDREDLLLSLLAVPVCWRPRHQKTRRKHPTSDRNEMMAEMVKEGVPVRDIAARFCVSRQRVNQIVSLERTAQRREHFDDRREIYRGSEWNRWFLTFGNELDYSGPFTDDEIRSLVTAAKIEPSGPPIDGKIHLYRLRQETSL